MNKSKSFKVIFTLVLMLTISTKLLNAFEGDDISLTLHKRVIDHSDQQLILNTGEEMIDFKGEPIENAKFTIYDVTSQYNSEVKNNNNDQILAINKLVNVFKGNYSSNDYDEIIQSEFTNKQGEAIFDKLKSKNDNDEYVVYAIVETETPIDTLFQEIAEPIILTFPVYKKDQNVIIKDIHLYPKNYVSDNTLTFTNTNLIIDENEYNISSIDLLNYNVKLNIPYDISKSINNGITYYNYSKNLIVDNIDDIFISNLIKDVDYTVNIDEDNQFSLSFNDTDVIQNLAGKSIEFTLTMKLKDNFDANTQYRNSGYLKMNEIDHPLVSYDKTEQKDVLFYSGSKTFSKVDGRTEASLEGVEFIVSRDHNDEIMYAKLNEYLELSDWTLQIDEASIITSNADGIFNLKGLSNDQYYIQETKALDDYVLNDELLPFSIIKDDASIYVIKNYKRSLLPMTGGNGIVNYLVFGSLMMIVGTLYLKKDKIINK